MKKDYANDKELYEALKADRERNMPLWSKIAKFVAIEVDPDYVNKPQKGGDAKDECIDDPTAAISVNQAGDYLQGVIWGTGENAITLEPSDYVLEMADASQVAPYFGFTTKRLLGQMNHSRAGLITSMKPYCYDQVGFGTSGIGAFINKAFLNGVEDNAIIFRNYGVDNLAIDEGKNGLVEIVFVCYRWRVNRIISEFATKDGVVDDALLKKLPKSVQDAYRQNDSNKEFTLVHGVIPREDFNQKLKGKRGARYRGPWRVEEEDKPFTEEDYRTLPIAVARLVKVRGEVFGRSSGTMLIATIMSVNYMVGKVMEIVEKQASPALGMWNSAIAGDNVVDTSADGLTVFNQVLAGGQNPLFPLYDVGDPSNIVKFLVPYLNEKIATAFKIDVLLDFSDSSSRTATEMMQRYAIRGKSLAGMVGQQKTELLEPLIHRCVSICEDVNLLGANPYLFADQAKKLASVNKSEMIIPDAVLKCKAEGKPWYKIKFNNEIDKLTRTEKLETLMKTLNAVTMIAAVFPAIIQAVDWYKFLADFREAIGDNGSFVLSADEFKAAVEKQAQMQAQMMALQAGKIGSEIHKNTAGAEKDKAEVKSGQAS